MTTPTPHNFRALCAELLEDADELADLMQGVIDGDYVPDSLTLQPIKGSMARARAALAQPEPVGPTDEALASFTAWFCRNYPGPNTIIHRPEWHAPKVFRAAESALARWGRPTPQPVPVSERLPGPEAPWGEPVRPTKADLDQLWLELYRFREGPTSGEVEEIALAALKRWGNRSDNL